MSKKFVIAKAAVIVLIAGVARGDLVEWPIASGGNGHFYEAVLVSEGINWYEANSAAQSSGGYLATVHSTAENDFAFSLVGGEPDFWFTDGANNTQGPWLGGYQPAGSQEPAGGWQWVTGEPWDDTHWASNEPNNSGGNEDGLQFFGQGVSNPSSCWNDVGRYGEVKGYIVEYVPEPTAFSLLVLGGLLATRRRR